MTVQSHTSDPDFPFITLAQSGNVEGLRAIYQKYFAAMYRFCFWQTQSEAEAEDLTQEVFVVVTKSLSKFRGDALFKNWLYQIAKNLIAGWIRRKQQLPQQALFEELSDSAEWIDPENEHFKMQLVKKLLLKLTPEERGVIQRRYLKNFSVKETAKALHLTESNVKVLTHRALQKLRQL